MTLALAVALCLSGGPTETYGALIARAIAAAHDGRLDEARQALDEAVACDPTLPDARVELGGLFFAEGRYAEAAAELKVALGLREELYARDLFASSLQLAGQGDEALAAWNALGKPRVGTIEISGLGHLLDLVARREVRGTEGDLLTLVAVRETRLRLREVGLFDGVSVKAAPRADGRADLDVALVERHGFVTTPVEFGLNLGLDALNHFVRLRYSDVGGTGATVGVQYRWERNRPAASAFMAWPRPFGLDANLRLSAFRGRQLYAVDSPLRSQSRGFDLGVRRVLGARTVAAVTFRGRDRSFSRPDSQALPGLVGGVELAIERRFIETANDQLDASMRSFASAGFRGSELTFGRAIVTATYRRSLSPSDGRMRDRSIFAVRSLWGYGSERMPIDEMFAAGGGADMDLPLRAHAQIVDGTVGLDAPLARSLVLNNMEWRRRLMGNALVRLGMVVFCDSARLARTAGHGFRDRDRSYADVGAGIRIGVGGASLLRVDYGHGLTDGRNAVFLGLNEVF